MVVEFAIRSFLALHQCYPSPTFVLDPMLDRPARYAHHVVTFRDEHPDPAVVVHELWHDCQWQRHGDARTPQENDARESEALFITTQFRQWSRD